jgi:hypothetical protein
MRRARSCRGTTAIETIIGAALLVVVIGGAAAMTKASTDVQQSTNDATTASLRADRAVKLLGDAIRKGSLGTMQHRDGTTFSDGTNDTGFKVQAVKAYTNAPVLDTVATYHFDLVGGATEGALTQTQNGVDRVIVNGVTSFTVTRSGSLFTIDIRTRSGPADSRSRTTHATLQVASRNP